MTNKILSAFVSLALVLAFSFPTAALAAQPEVQVENHTAAGAQTVSKLFVDGVDAPEVGKALDDKATVSTAEGATWDIPVLWIGDDLQLATEVVEGRTYLPALAFFVPQDYAVEGDSFTVAFSDSLSKLFGDENAVSVFDARTGITYILPISLRDFFTPTAAAGVAAGQEDDDPEEGFGDGGNYPALTNVEIWCAQTARDALSDDDLEWLIDLVLHTLEPQAVNLLIDSFPAFKAAAVSGQIGTNIGLYIYYLHGDKDGMPEHEAASNALAYVNGDAAMIDGKLKYCYMIGIDVDDMLLKQDGKPVRNANTGKFILDRTGSGTITFNNTVVHEMFHAFMDDYNRTGMLGAKNVTDGYTPGGKFATEAQEKLFNAVHYPRWFIEGTASAVENVYQFRHAMFEKLFPAANSTDLRNDLINNYLNAKNDDGKWLYFELEYTDNPNVDTTQARYVTGYLATLYLAQLAAQKDDSIGTAISDQGVVSAGKLRLGLDSILKRMHNGETLDQVIRHISTIRDGEAPLYTDADDFAKKFIKGPPNDASLPENERVYRGDDTSIEFMSYFIRYMQTLENTPGRKYMPNGSILFDFDQDFNIPLDESKQYTSDYFIIITSNGFVESSVPDSVAFVSGGKSDPPNASTSTVQSAAAKAEAELPLAAKAAAEPSLVEEVDEPEPGTAEEIVAESENDQVAELTAEAEYDAVNNIATEPANEPVFEPEAPEKNVDNPTQESAEGTGLGQ